MNANLIIRFAGLEDINTIGFLAQQIWPGTYREILSPEQLDYMMTLLYNPDALKNQMMEQKHRFILLEEDREPIGFASYSIIGTDTIYKLHKLYVLSNQQGKGLGKAIIDFIVEEIKPAGATSLQLSVNRYNKAKQFYEKLGFNVIREEDIDIGNGYFMNDYIMELPIN